MNITVLKKHCHILIICLLLANNLAFASIHKHLWPLWLAHNPLSQEVISHEPWQAFLSCSVKTNQEGINLVDYPHLSPQALALLRQYINHLSKIDIKHYNRNEQLAYWINLYNALTVQTIANYYPVSSIRDINNSPGLFSIGPWGANLITIQGIRLSLDDIHNRIIRAIWNDPRTHYALNNGSIGAPNLRKEAFQGRLLEQQLNDAALNYIHSLRGVQIVEGKLVLSKLYHWFIEDFGKDEQDIIDHLLSYARQPLQDELKQIHSIDTYMYNWHLNSTVKPETVSTQSF